MVALFFVVGRAKNLQILPLFQSDGRCPSMKQFDANFAVNLYRPQFWCEIPDVYSATCVELNFASRLVLRLP
jgi:hypothetical protein